MTRLPETHRTHYVAYSWCPDGVYLVMRDDSFTVAFNGGFPLCDYGPCMDFEDACYWYQLAANNGLIYW